MLVLIYHRHIIVVLKQIFYDEINKFIDSKGSIPTEWKETPGKYSVQLQKFQIQKVDRIRSE